MTRDNVKELLCAITSAFPNFKVTDATTMANVWTMILEPYDYSRIQRAFLDYCRSNKTGFAPSVSQLIDQAVTRVDDSIDSMSAWSMVAKALRNSTYNAEEEFSKLPTDVQNALGGSFQLHAWAVDEAFNESVASALFQRNYKTVLERKRFDIATNNKLSITETEREVLTDGI